VETGYLSIGSNVGRREWAVLEAVNRLDSESRLTVSRLSSLYETEPFACPPQPSFINAVAEVRSLLDPFDLLKRIKAIEEAMGREGGHNEPREIDIDIVSIGSRVLATPELTLPHPRYAQRAFVLVPLAEVAPAFRCPLSGRSVRDMLEGVVTKGVEKVSTRTFVFL